MDGASRAADIEAPTTSATATGEELLDYYRQMFLIRRCEITSDVEYKVWYCRVPLLGPWWRLTDLLPSVLLRTGSQHSWLLPLVRWPGGRRDGHPRRI